MSKLKENKKIKEKKISALSMMKFIVIAASILHLVFSNVHVNALLVLKNDLSGFIMFMFVLMGLILVFEATRVNGQKISEQIKLLLFSVIDLGFGSTLIYMYISELNIMTESGIKYTYQALGLSGAVCLAILVAMVMNIVSMIKKEN